MLLYFLLMVVPHQVSICLSQLVKPYEARAVIVNSSTLLETHVPPPLVLIQISPVTPRSQP